MKRKGNLFEMVVSKDNISQSIYSASKGKHYKPDVALILSNFDFYVDQLHKSLVGGAYKHGSYEVFTKKCGVKERLIYKASFYPDRVVHHCIVNVLQPIWQRQIIRDTYGSIPGRGVHDAARRIKTALLNELDTRYALKLDISKFYASVNHTHMFKAIERKIKDKRLLSLIKDNIESAPGIALGNYTSQWLGNMILDELDHRCKEVLRLKYYYRYCDDILILNSDKTTLHNALNYIRDYLANIGLSLKRNYQIYPVAARGIDFLGYRFFHGYTLMRKRIVKSFKKRLNDDYDKCMPAMPSYYGWFKHANTYRLTKKYLSWTNLITN